MLRQDGNEIDQNLAFFVLEANDIFDCNKKPVPIQLPSGSLKSVALAW